MTLTRIRHTTHLDDTAAVLAVLAALRGNPQTAADRAGLARWRAQRRAALTNSHSSPGTAFTGHHRASRRNGDACSR